MENERRGWFGGDYTDNVDKRQNSWNDPQIIGDNRFVLQTWNPTTGNHERVLYWIKQWVGLPTAWGWARTASLPILGGAIKYGIAALYATGYSAVWLVGAGLIAVPFLVVLGVAVLTRDLHYIVPFTLKLLLVLLGGVAL